jgi:hypothetical protein
VRAGVQADGVDAKLAVAEVFDPGGPRLRPDCGKRRCGVAGDPQQPPGPQVGVDELLGGALIDQPPGAEDANVAGDPLHVGQDVAGEDDGAPAP